MTHKIFQKILPTYIEKKYLIIALLFGLLQMIGYTMYTYHDIRRFFTLYSFLIGCIFILTGYIILMYIGPIRKALSEPCHKYIRYIAFGIIIITNILTIIALYPGVLTNNIYYQVLEAIGEESLEQTFPIIYTLYLRGVLWVSKISKIPVLTIYFTIRYLMILSFNIYILKTLQDRRYIIYTIINISPAILLYNYSTTNDVIFMYLFALSAILLTKHKPACVICIFLTSLFRNNFIYGYILFFILYRIIKKCSWKLAIPILLYAIYAGILLIPGLKIKPVRPQEYLSIPCNMAAEVLAHNNVPEELRTSYTRFVDQYYLDQYVPEHSDPVRLILHRSHYANRTKEYWDDIYQLFKIDPISPLNAELNIMYRMWYVLAPPYSQTNNFIDPADSSVKSILADYGYYDLSNKKSKLPWLETFFKRIMSKRTYPWPKPFMLLLNCAMPVWVMLFCALSNKKIEVLSLYLITYALTLFVVSNVMIRYMLPLIICIPWIIYQEDRSITSI